MFSVAVWPFPALPAKFIEELKSQESTEGATVTLRCELSKMAPVEWRKGKEILRDGDRYSLRQDGTVCELQIRGLAVEDAGQYSCVCGQERTSATLAIKGKDCVWIVCGHMNLWLGVYTATTSSTCGIVVVTLWSSVLGISHLPFLSRRCSYVHVHPLAFSVT
jgi:hypothetical protein